ncbi:hypothetical protein HNQ51_001992 [Inhella inkyongensis]|uniref:Phosphate ABC transporter substrate-binding protein n=1 Tax=Inhella inkyongensis TaxID=392593 RepID=A0A840S5C5_9BURK|nr:hypothetical protein [Inhella inkyongensis]MBB5204678.1 hypothetical protein [Inhella inkyongensis]
MHKPLPWLGLLFSLFATQASAQVVVIVNPKSEVKLTAEQVASLYMGRSTSLPGGISQPVDLPEANAAREQFYSKAAGKTGAQVKATWARLAFSGKATPPKELATAADIKKFVAANVDAIGYIDKSAVDSSVKVVVPLE